MGSISITTALPNPGQGRCGQVGPALPRGSGAAALEGDQRIMEAASSSDSCRHRMTTVLRNALGENDRHWTYKVQQEGNLAILLKF